MGCNCGGSKNKRERPASTPATPAPRMSGVPTSAAPAASAGGK